MCIHHIPLMTHAHLQLPRSGFIHQPQWPLGVETPAGARRTQVVSPGNRCCRWAVLTVVGQRLKPPTRIYDNKLTICGCSIVKQVQWLVTCEVIYSHNAFEGGSPQLRHERYKYEIFACHGTIWMGLTPLWRVIPFTEWVLLKSSVETPKKRWVSRTY